MPWNTEETPTIRGKLTRHLGRLQEDLGSVAEQVREAVARAVGRSVAEAVGEAVYEILGPSDVHSRPLLELRTGNLGRSSPPRREWDDPWGAQETRSAWSDPYSSDDSDDRRFDDEASSEEMPSPHEPPRVSRYGQAVAAGLQAGAWWLQRSGRVSLVAALAVGAVAGVVALAGQLGGGAALVAPALGLGYLIELVRSAGRLLGRAGMP